MNFTRWALASALLLSAPTFARAQDNDGLPAPTTKAAAATSFSAISVTSAYRESEPGYETFYSRQRKGLSDYTFSVGSNGAFTLTSPDGTKKGTLSPTVMARLQSLVADSKLSEGTPSYRSSIEGHGAAQQPFTLETTLPSSKVSKISGVAQSAFMVYGPQSKTPLVDFMLKLSFTERWLQANAPIETSVRADDPALRSVILDQLKDPKISDEKLEAVLGYIGDMSKTSDNRYQVIADVKKILKTDGGPEKIDQIAAVIDKAARTSGMMSQPYEDDNDRLDNKLRKVAPGFDKLDAATQDLIRNRARAVFTLQGSNDAAEIGIAKILKDRVSAGADKTKAGDK